MSFFLQIYVNLLKSLKLTVPEYMINEFLRKTTTKSSLFFLTFGGQIGAWDELLYSTTIYNVS